MGNQKVEVKSKKTRLGTLNSRRQALLRESVSSPYCVPHSFPFSPTLNRADLAPAPKGHLTLGDGFGFALEGNHDDLRTVFAEHRQHHRVTLR